MGTPIAAPALLPAQSEARFASKVTLVAIFVLMIAKGIAGMLLNSIALTSEALHTLLDLATALLAYVTLRAAQEPPDAEHPYGHGKVENLMALVQAVMIMVPALGIGYYSADHLLQGKYHFDTDKAAIGLWTMGLTMVVNLGLMRYLGAVAKRTGSASIAANATHERVDFVSSGIVMVGLILIQITGALWIDPALGIITAIYILKEGWELLYDSAQVLLDRAAPQNHQDRLHAVLHRHGRIVLAYSNVRTRMFGQEVHADLDVQLCAKAPLSEVVPVIDHLESELESAIPGIQVHLRPRRCAVSCHECPVDPMRLHELLDVHTPVPQELKEAERDIVAGTPLTATHSH